MEKFDATIIGAGAAGLFCAGVAGQLGLRVLLLDHAPKVAEKIRISGGGRCNFTNRELDPRQPHKHFLGDNPNFCRSALSRYTPADFIELLQRHGLPFHEKHKGQLFCDRSAQDLIELLLKECEAGGVQRWQPCAVQAVSYSDADPSARYQLQTDRGPVACRSLVVATGGLSIPTLGASGFGYQIARQFGHNVLPTRAGLVPFTVTEPQLKALCAELSGTAVDCLVSCNDKSFRENLLFTHRGLSGPAMLQISSYWHSGDALEINLLPDRDALDWLNGQQAERPNIELKTLLAEVFTKKMAGLLCELWWASKPLKQYTPGELQGIAAQLSAWRLVPAGTEGYRTAEVTLGGVDTREVSSKTMESQKSPGLYFVGEVLDVTGHLGGFNFQWAWASGHAAGEVV